MKLENFMTVATSFLEQNLAPGLTAQYGDFAQWIFGGALALLSPAVKQRILNNADLLKSLGIMNESNDIDIAALEKFMNGAFSKTPTLRMNPKELLNLKFQNPLLDKFLQGELVFTKEEGEEFIQLLKSHNN